MRIMAQASDSEEVLAVLYLMERTVHLSYGYSHGWKLGVRWRMVARAYPRGVVTWVPRQPPWSNIGALRRSFADALELISMDRSKRGSAVSFACLRN
jgi:hypothetical protein